MNRRKRLSRKNKRIRAIILFVVLIGLITIGLKEVFSKDENIDVMADVNFDSINNDTLEENNVDTEKEKENEIISENEEEKIKNAILNVVGDNVSNYGIYYYDLYSGKEVAINGDKAFFAASTTKIALAMIVVDKIQQGTIKSNQLVTYKDEFYEEQDI